MYVDELGPVSTSPGLGKQLKLKLFPLAAPRLANAMMGESSSSVLGFSQFIDTLTVALIQLKKMLIYNNRKKK